MLVCWPWLEKYVALKMPLADLESKLAMSGLNHEGTETVDGQTVIDLEVTSNRPDCLGHIGIAREIAVLFGESLKIPNPQPKENGPATSSLVEVVVEDAELCPQYTARVIRGAKIQPSPGWLQEYLTAIGITPINNVVDITNFVLMECGQPLHAFDFAKLDGGKIIVRPAKAGEKIDAIDHKTYELDPNICVIADAKQPVAIAGVMGGADTEISESTTDILIESASFAPLAVRYASRKLKLGSDSSFRFERGVDPVGVDWASRRCAELILELVGGELCEGVVAVEADRPAPLTIGFNAEQVQRLIGITVPAKECQQILSALGCEVTADSAEATSFSVVPPSWRRDLSRPVDLIEEVVRVHGYEQIPEDAAVPLFPAPVREEDRIRRHVRTALSAAGFDEVLTPSVVPPKWVQNCNPWVGDSQATFFSTIAPMLKGADHLRTSLIPSLLEVCKINEAAGNEEVQLYEVASVYLPGKDDDKVAYEPRLLSLSTQADLRTVRGILEAMLDLLHVEAPLEFKPATVPLLAKGAAAEVWLGETLFGFAGKIDLKALKSLEDNDRKMVLRKAVTIAEVNLDVLTGLANLIPTTHPVSSQPAIQRDYNFILDEAVAWSALAGTVAQAAGPLLETLDYQETFRNPKEDGKGKKRILFTVTWRAADRTLTGDEAGELQQQIIDAAGKEHAAKLVG